MGKGQIISGGTNGNYQVKVLMNRTQYDKIKNRLVSTIETLTILLGVELPVIKRSIYNLKISSCQKQLEYLENNIPEDETVSAWCVDLSEDLTGEIGTIEVPGERGVLQIKPGFTSAEYIQAEDGQLTPSPSMTPAGVFYNLAMLPGWQKWKPLFRYATITAINGNLADITLEDTKSSQQNLEINQSSTISDVSIEYMDCNEDAFEEGDSVLVKFENQSWEQPKIIGFKDNPKPCDVGIYIRPTFNGNYAVNGNQEIVVKYTYEEIDYELSETITDGAGGELESYTKNLMMIPRKVIESDTEISVYVKTTPRLFTYYENVGIEGDYDTQIYWGVPEIVYLKQILKKESVDKLLKIPTGKVEVGGKEFDYFEVDFIDLKILLRSPTFAMYSREEYGGGLTYVNDTYPNCILNSSSGSEPNYDLTHDRYYRTFEPVFNSPTQCPNASSGNVFGEPGFEVCESYSTTSETESDRIEDISSIVILTTETGENQVFNDFTRIIKDRLDYWICDPCPWAECLRPEGYTYVEGIEYHMTWEYKMVETPVSFL